MTHFKVPAREMLFREPVPCPVYPHLTFDGIAVDPDDHQHLIFNTPKARFYAGPDRDTVHRRARITADALRSNRAALTADAAEVLIWWVDECWESLVDELVDQLTPALHTL